MRVTFANALFNALAMVISKIARLTPQSTAVFVCDIQEKFRGRIWQFPSVISVAGKMVSIRRICVLTYTYLTPKVFSNRLKPLAR